MEDWMMEIKSLLDGRLRTVFDEARDLGNRYLQAVVEGNKSKEWNRKNTLQFRVRQRGNALAIEWYLIQWFGAKGQERQLRRNYIRKRYSSRRRDAQVFSYCIADLLRHTSGWDDELVSEVETEASQYRREAHYLADMLVTLGRLERFAAAQARSKLWEEAP